MEIEHLLDSQRSLEASRDAYVDLFDSGPLPSLVLDERGCILFANRAVLRLLGRSLRDLVGRRLTHFVVPADRPIITAHFIASAREPSNTSDVRLCAGTGQTLTVQVSSSRSSLGRGMQITLVDLSGRERDKVEKAELREAIASAQKASAAKDKFIATMSHELRTPLTPVLMAATAFRDQDDLSPKLRNVFSMIARCVQLESRLVDDLLDVTRIAQGKMRCERISSDLHAVVGGVCEALALEIQQKGQSLFTELQADHAVAEIDSVRMHQVFSNLLRNAIKFSPIGAKIYVRSWNAGARIVVEVEDQGVGMTPGALAHIFKPFKPLDDLGTPTTGTTGGLGLGLTIAKGIVDLHGGHLEAASRGRGLGARFVVQLPTTTQTVASVEAGVPSPPLAPAFHGRCRVLLVEDESVTAGVVTELLRAQGFEVVTTSTVREALAVNVDEVDIIVSDVGLPDGTGLDLIRQLQASGHHAAIALSGFGMRTDVEASIKAGFDVHLTKPIDFDRLIGTIRRLAPKAAEADPHLQS